ncbi:hypothetical protein ACIBCT_17285 [Streptosporangium sp. NPDC050855]|uniref:hypothetical protein n=1 Tax=Streptosporangium sp. NPDC050855 TaxID=3366194 RepID=UPI0037B1713F
MRSVTPVVTAVVLMTGPGVPAGHDAAPTPAPRATTSPAVPAEIPATAGTAKGVTTGTAAAGPSGGDGIPPAWRDVASLRVLPRWPRQASHVRVFVHCPPGSDHAIIGSTAFTLKGSRRLYREVGLGLSGRGLAHRAVSVSYSALPGRHGACLRCVKVTVDERTRVRRIQVIGRDSAPLRVRRFSVRHFFDR